MQSILAKGRALKVRQPIAGGAVRILQRHLKLHGVTEASAIPEEGRVRLYYELKKFFHAEGYPKVGWFRSKYYSFVDVFWYDFKYYSFVDVFWHSLKYADLPLIEKGVCLLSVLSIIAGVILSFFPSDKYPSLSLWSVGSYIVGFILLFPYERLFDRR
jgi:hypothetical protein